MGDYSEKSPFRVIVVGGGVAGLAAAHALRLAGIDHVVLERRAEVAPHAGASIAMYPNGGRILHQFGIYDAVRRHTTPPGRWWARLPDGKLIADNSVFRVLEENHGSGLLLIERRQFLQELYDNLPDKSVVRTSARVEDIRELEDGVEVVLANGEVEKGDLVLGCDGVYSSVRQIMWDHANKFSPGLITVEEKKAIKANWKCLVVMTTAIPELGDRDLTVVHNNDSSHMFTMTPTAGYFFVFFRMDETVTYPNLPRYTDQDAEALAKQIANHPVSETVLFGEVWKKRIRANVVNLEEGVLDHWFHGRIVLAGDAAHKVTPNMAFGGNSGLESIAVFTNHLRRVVHEREVAGPGARKSSASKPTTAELANALSAYQYERKARMDFIANFSGEVTNIQAWHKWWQKFMAIWFVPYTPRGFFGNQLSEIVRGAPCLDFVDASDFPTGRLPFKNQTALKQGSKGQAAGIAYKGTSVEKRGAGSVVLGWASAAAAVATVLYAANALPLITNVSASILSA